MDAALIETARFRLRPLTAADATERYWSWLQSDEVRARITFAATTPQIGELRQYIEERAGRDDVLFLGIFDRESGLHIGNIKFEPVDASRGYAVMGVLIGDPTFRGRGVTQEVLTAAGHWLRDRRGIHEIVLGVHRDNDAAIRVYQKTGFVAAPTPHIPNPPGFQMTMVWRL